MRTTFLLIVLLVIAISARQIFKGRYPMKGVFVGMWLVSILAPFIAFASTIDFFAHNHFRARVFYLELKESGSEHVDGGSLGLTRKQLNSYPRAISEQYEASVNDGKRLGEACDRLLLEHECLAAILLACTLFGVKVAKQLASCPQEPAGERR
jgi:hypothetical protein